MKWISVKDQLPEHNQVCIVWVPSLVTIAEYHEHRDEWQYMNRKYSRDITHWQPLPEKPE